MTPEKDATLCNKYPKIFRDRNASPQESCMCWGFSCGDGWFDLIDTLCYRIQQHVDNLVTQHGYAVERGEVPPEDARDPESFQVVAAQVKEKFGGLRFYVDGADEYVAGLIAMAESLSYRTCENCGALGASPEKVGRFQTLCVKCRRKKKSRRSVSP